MGTSRCPACDRPITGARPSGSVAPDGAAGHTGKDAVLEWLREDTLGEYDVIGALGHGGMSVVYLAHDIALDRDVAIKVMSPALAFGDGLVERFKREARIGASLSHPNIMPVYRVTETNRLLFFTMKYVSGCSLAQIIHERGALSIPVVQALISQIGLALGYAHRRGAIHRDVKPANIMLDVEGWPIITDFGIVKLARRHRSHPVGHDGRDTALHESGAMLLAGRGDRSLGPVLVGNRDA